jgi:hypothetical protein
MHRSASALILSTTIATVADRRSKTRAFLSFHSCQHTSMKIVDTPSRRPAPCISRSWPHQSWMVTAAPRLQVHLTQEQVLHQTSLATGQVISRWLMVSSFWSQSGQWMCVSKPRHRRRSAVHTLPRQASHKNSFTRSGAQDCHRRFQRLSVPGGCVCPCKESDAR